MTIQKFSVNKDKKFKIEFIMMQNSTYWEEIKKTNKQKKWTLISLIEEGSSREVSFFK